MSQKDKYSVRNLVKQFPHDGACLEFLFDTLHSRACSCGGIYKPLFKIAKKGQLTGRKQFHCSACSFQIAPMAGTLFEKSPTPLTLWFHAIFIFSNAKSGISAKEMERQLGVTYKCAWRILHLIRKSLPQSTERIKGDVEMDEGYFGGQGKSGRNNEQLGRTMRRKTAVIAAIERGGEMRAQVVKSVTAKALDQFLRKNVDPMPTRLYTDGSNRYTKGARPYYHDFVIHNKRQFVKGNVHVNNVESFWSHFNRSVKGTHKAISKQHAQSYLDAFVFHYNNRYNDKDRFDALLGALLG